jgi:hypothetical protein
MVTVGWMNRREFLGCMGCAGMAALTGCTTPRPSERKGTGMSTGKRAVRPESFSYCGMDCTSCDVFKATVHGDQEARMRAVKLWTKTAQEHWKMETLDPMILDCTGCRAEGYVQHKGYGRCPIRPCARKRGLSSCGLCPTWRECERLSGVLADAPEARENLEQVAKGSNHPIR